MRYTPSGQAVTNFSMATTEKWTGQDGQPQERTLWWRVSAFGKMAETINQYLHKGSKVYVEGRITGDPATGGPRVYTKKDGTTGSSFEVVASTVKFLSSKGENASNGAAAPAAEHAPAGEDTDEIPF